MDQVVVTLITGQTCMAEANLIMRQADPLLT
jgi:hypothetical protein